VQPPGAARKLQGCTYGPALHATDAGCMTGSQAQSGSVRVADCWGACASCAFLWAGARGVVVELEQLAVIGQR
jgi:hypothetical protein